MADFIPKNTRSRIMSSIRSSDTRPEQFVRKRVWAEGFRYRLYVGQLPDKPDLVLAKYGMAVFIHGCFWHQHGCLGPVDIHI